MGKDGEGTPLINGLSDHDVQVLCLFNMIVPDDRI